MTESAFLRLPRMIGAGPMLRVDRWAGSATVEYGYDWKDDNVSGE